jgi:hypothetical protein
MPKANKKHSADFRRRSQAAKLGWRRRRSRRTWFVTLAYISTGNGYTLDFKVTPYKRLGEHDVIALTIGLIRRGHFDDSPENDSKDLRWAASFINSETATSRSVSHRHGTAYLVSMERT